MISVIVPVWNAEAHLPGLLNQLAAQAKNGAAFEAVFVDDGSADGSLALLRSAQTPFPMRVLHQENRGAGAARNAGFSCASGEWALFVDADDALAPDALLLLQERAAEEPSDALFFGIARLQEDGIVPLAGSLPAVREEPSELMDQFLRDPKRFGPYSVLFRRELFSAPACTPFPEGCAYYEDYIFLLRLMRRAEAMLRSESVLYGYRMTEGSAMARFSAERISCLEAVRQELRSPVGQGDSEGFRHLRRWLVPRLYWSALWQACLALPSSGWAGRFLKETDGRRLLRQLVGYPDKKVSATALLARVFPQGFAALARMLGGKRSRIGRMPAGDAEALLRECRAAALLPEAEE